MLAFSTTWRARLDLQPGNWCSLISPRQGMRALHELYGGRIDYGAEHSSTFKHKRFGAALKAKWPNWSADSPIDLIGHSHGGNVCIDLALKLTHDFFGVGSDAQWVRSIVTLSSPINGTTLSTFSASPYLITGRFARFQPSIWRARSSQLSGGSR